MWRRSARWRLSWPYMMDCPHDTRSRSIGRAEACTRTSAITGASRRVSHVAHVRRSVRLPEARREPLRRAPVRPCLRLPVGGARLGRGARAARQRREDRSRHRRAALSGGMAFEALNHIGQAQTPMVIILNDNEMSISRNVGALMKHLGYMRATPQYRQTRDSVQSARKQRRVRQRVGEFRAHERVDEAVRPIPRTMIFEQLGIISHGAHRRSRYHRSFQGRRWQPCCTPTCLCSCTWSLRRGAADARGAEPRKFTASRRSKIAYGDGKKKPSAAPS